RRFSAELLEHQLLNWVIEKTPAGSNTGLAVIGTPRESDAWCECFVIGLRQAWGNTRITGYNKTGGGLAVAICIRTTTGKDRAGLSRAESLHVPANIRQRCVKFPPQSIV